MRSTTPGRRRSARACQACQLRDDQVSRHSTIECDDRLRMDQHADLLRRHPNSQRASMTSSALFIIVAESTVILRPISTLGARSACSGVASRKVVQLPRAERPARRGEEDPVHAPRPARDLGQALEDRRVLAVHRDEGGAARRAASDAERPARPGSPCSRAPRRLPAARRGQAGLQPGSADRSAATTACAPPACAAISASARALGQHLRCAGRAARQRRGEVARRGTVRQHREARVPLDACARSASVRPCAVSANTSWRSR